MEKYCRAGQATGDNIIRGMRIACWIPKATNTRTEYVTISFPLQRTTILRYTYIAWPVNVCHMLLHVTFTARCGCFDDHRVQGCLCVLWHAWNRYVVCIALLFMELNDVSFVTAADHSLTSLNPYTRLMKARTTRTKIRLKRIPWRSCIKYLSYCMLRSFWTWRCLKICR